MDEKISSHYKKKEIAILKCVLSKSKKERIKYANILLKIMNTELEQINEIIERLVQASITLNDLSDLLECFYEACGKTRTTDIINTWKVLKKRKEDKRKDLER